MSRVCQRSVQIIAIASLVLLWVLVAFAADGNQRVDNWREDLLLLEKQLPQLHKNLFFKLSEEEFRQRMSDLRERCASLNDAEIFIELSKIIALIGDSHTLVQPAFRIEGVPVQFYQFADGIYPVAYASKYSEIAHKRLVGVGGQPIEEVANSIKELIPLDNEAQVARDVPNYLNDYTILAAMGLAENRVIRYEFEDATGTRSTVDLAVESFQGLSWERPYTPGRGKTPLYMKNQSWFWYEYLPDSQVVYLQYNQCWDRSSERRYRPNSPNIAQLPDFAEFGEEVIGVIKSKPVRAVVIDLRNNGGGNSEIGTRFIERLGEELKQGQDFKVFGIIGRQTFSSAIINAVQLRHYLNAVLYGEPTAGKPNHYGEVKRLTLPNSGWRVSYSTKYFQFVPEDTDSLYPDVEVTLSYDDFINGNDPVLKTILHTLREE